MLCIDIFLLLFTLNPFCMLIDISDLIFKFFFKNFQNKKNYKRNKKSKKLKTKKTKKSLANFSVTLHVTFSCLCLQENLNLFQKNHFLTVNKHRVNCPKVFLFYYPENFSFSILSRNFIFFFF